MVARRTTRPGSFGSGINRGRFVAFRAGDAASTL